MTISYGMVLFGALLIIAGWKNVSLSALARGDNTVPKPAVTAGGTTGPTPPPAASGNNHPGQT